MTEQLPREKSLGRIILKVKRQFYIQQKAIFEGAIIAYAKTLPEPVLGPEVRDGEAMVGWENSPVLMRIRDKFLSYCGFKPDMMAGLWKIVIDKADYDPAYRDVAQFVLEELVEAVLSGEWKPRQVGYPPPSIWKEPRSLDGSHYGGYNGRSFKKYIKGGE